MITTPPVDLPSIPPDALEFARQNELTSLLRPILTATRDIFSGSLIAMRLEEDAEIASEQHLVIDVDVTGWSVEEMYSARNRWSQEFCCVCPSEKAGAFQIRLGQKP